jgi:hypothetical protein
MFAGWYTVSGGDDPGFTVDAWQAFSFTDVILAVAALTALIVGAISLSGASVSLPVAGSAITTTLGIIAALLIAFRILNPPGDLHRELGAWVGLAWAAGIVVGGYIGMGEEPA